MGFSERTDSILNSTELNNDKKSLSINIDRTTKARPADENISPFSIDLFETTGVSSSAHL